MAFTNSDDINVLQASDNAVVGAGAGNDRYILTAESLTNGQRISISDTMGMNTLQLVGGLVITGSRVSSSALELTLNNGAVITILGADAFTYVTGGSPFSGTGGTPQNYNDFATQSLRTTVPASNAAPTSGPSVTVNNNGGTTPNSSTPGQTVTVTAPASANEGQTVNFTVNAANVPNNTVYSYTITGVQSADVMGGSLTGFVTINNGAGSIPITLVADNLTEGNENLTLTLTVPGQATAPSATVAVVDTSMTPASGVTVTAPASTNEGQTVNFTVNAANVPNNTVYSYTITGVQSADVMGGSLTGFVTINNGTGSIPITLVADNLTEGNENLTLTLTVPGQATAPSATVAVVDTSTSAANFTLTASPATRTVAETNASQPLTYTFSLDSTPQASVSFDVAVVTASTTADGSDFTLNTATITFGPNVRTQDINLLTILGDTLGEASETITLRITGNNLRNTPVDLSVTVTDDDMGNSSTLTTAADRYTGTASDEIISGVASDLFIVNTLNNSDQIDGAGGRDTLRITASSNFGAGGLGGAPFPANPTGAQGFIRNVEILDLTNAANTDRTFNAANIAGLDTVRWTSSTTNNGSLTVDNLAAPITSLTVSGLTGTGKGVKLAHATATTNANDRLAVTLNGVGTREVVSPTGAVTAFAAPIFVQSSNVSVENADFTVTGNNTIELASTDSVGSNSISVKGSGSLQITATSNTLTSLNASEATGSVTATISGTTGNAVTTIRGGSADDMITVHGGRLQANVVLDGGAGMNDRLVITSIANNLGPNITNFETLELQAITAATNIIGLTGSSGVGRVVLRDVPTATPPTLPGVALNLSGIFNPTGVTLETVAALGATNTAPSVFTSNVAFGDALGTARVLVGERTQLGSANANNVLTGSVTFNRATSLSIDAIGALGQTGTNGSLEVLAPEATSVALNSSPSPAGLAIALADFVAIDAGKALTLTVNANRALDIQGSKFGLLTTGTINTTNVVNGTGVNLGSINTLNLSGNQNTSSVVLGNIGSANSNFNTTVTANGLPGGLTIGQVTSGQDVTVNLNGLTGQAIVGAITAARAATLTLTNTAGRAALVNMIGTVSGATVDIDATNSTANTVIGDGAGPNVDIVVKDRLAFIGSAFSPNTLDIQAAPTSTALAIALNTLGSNDDDFAIGGSSTQTSITVTGDLTGNGALGDSIVVISSASAADQTISLSALAGVEVATITGGAGSDVISGTSGNDQITGGAGVDMLTGGAGNDSFRYTAAAELFSGTALVDSITGGDGNDDAILIDNGAAAFTVAATASFGARISGVESIKANAASGAISLTLNNNAFEAGIVRVDLSGDTNATGNNVINVSAESTAANGYGLTGSAGIDSITGGAGNDTIVGGAGADVITGGAGADSSNGGVGLDTLAFASAAELIEDATVIGGDGTDTVRLNTAAAALTLMDASFARVTEVETLALAGTGAQTVTLGANSSAAFTTGIAVTTVATATSLNLQGALSTVVINAVGTNNNDTLVGGSAADNLSGGAGADVITGGASADVLDGGSDDDTFVYAAMADFVTGNVVVDSVTGGVGNADKIQINAAISIVTGDSLARVGTVEQLVAETQASAVRAHSIVQGTDANLSSIRTIDLSGDTNAASTGVINLAGITNAITGTTLKGVLAGQNTITGGAGVDSITGGNVADTITGGAGADVIDGGAAADTYIFSGGTVALNGTDLIASAGFTAGAAGDVLNFRAVTFAVAVTETVQVAANNAALTAANLGNNGVIVLQTDAVGNAAALKTVLDATNLDTTNIGNRVIAYEIDATTVGVAVINNADATNNNNVTVELIGQIGGFANQAAVDAFTAALMAANFDII